MSTTQPENQQNRAFEAVRRQAFGEFTHPSFEAQKTPQSPEVETRPQPENPRAFRHRLDEAGYTQAEWTARTAERLKVEGLAQIGALVDGPNGLRDNFDSSQIDLSADEVNNREVWSDYDLAA